jgi:hypothetical protein
MKMIGALIGAAAVAGFVACRFYRYHRWAGMGPGCGHHGHGHGRDDEGYGPRHHPGARFARWGSRRALYAILAELDCSPAQERLIREEVGALFERLRELRDEKDASRQDLGRAFGGATLDRDALAAMFGRHDQRLVALRGELVAALGRIHATLDDKQRARLVELATGGGRSGPGAGPYR